MEVEQTDINVFSRGNTHSMVINTLKSQLTVKREETEGSFCQVMIFVSLPCHILRSKVNISHKLSAGKKINGTFG